MKQKEQAVQECERDMGTLKGQLQSFVNELQHLKALEQRYKEENADLQRHTEQEQGANQDLVT